MITERTLKKWRREALGLEESLEIESSENKTVNMGRYTMEEINQRILRMTQILLDQHLLRKEKKVNE